MNRLEQLFEELGYNASNGLFYLNESKKWIHKFPYRISRVLRDVIRPDAFYSLHYTGKSSDHPEPINNPLILFFYKPDDITLSNIAKWSFCFSQASLLIIVKDDFSPINIYHGYDFDLKSNNYLKEININIKEFSMINLSVGKTWELLFNKYYKNVHKVDQFLLDNIIDARRILIAKDGCNLAPKVANRLIGRLLFVRYLIDRKVTFSGQRPITGETILERRQNLNLLIKSKTNLYEFFEYLTKRFNGDLFPLIESDENGVEIYNEVKLVKSEHLLVLHHLFSCSSFFKNGGVTKGNYIVQRSLFDVYDFEIIPVELISNIYENFIGNVQENSNVKFSNFIVKSKREEVKAFYTPPFIVDYILSQTVVPYLENKRIASCKVLDPSCGSGIFLVEALRKLIEKEISLNQNAKLKKRYAISNNRLWQLLHDNIFGIDIDADAIEITIFSLYITLLDYKTPIEIEKFKFKPLKGTNLFGGKEADFFNENAPFNSLFKETIKLDFIIGNPPWGKVSQSEYEKYILQRNSREQKLADYNIILEIGNKEIAQAFLVRVSDLISENNDTKCAFIVTGKCLYNSDSTVKNWRKYFLKKFQLNQVVELSAVNNKIAGGNQIFDAARQSTCIIFYNPIKVDNFNYENNIVHISVKPNKFFNYFRTIIIEKYDIKNIRQTKFIEELGGNDWLWKVLLHGNTLDYYFIKRLKNFNTIDQLLKENNFEYNGGLKIKDGVKKFNTEELKNYDFIEIESRREFQPYSLKPTLTWGEEVARLHNKKSEFDGHVGYLPDLYFFKGEKLLLKKGLKADDGFKAVAAYTEKNLVFTSSVCSIRTSQGVAKNETSSSILKSLTGLLNSKLFTYFILHSSSSAGVDRTRAYFDEFFSFPANFNKKMGDLVIEIQKKSDNLPNNVGTLDLFNSRTILSSSQEIDKLKNNLERVIAMAYNVDEIEQSLIDYSSEVSIPVVKRQFELDIFKPLSLEREKDKDYLEQYGNIYIKHFKERFNSNKNHFFVNVILTSNYICFHFIVTNKGKYENEINFSKPENDHIITILGDLGIHNISKNLYIKQDVRGFSLNTFYIVKPNEKKYWHRAMAHNDLSEFIEAIAKSELTYDERR